MTFAVRNGEAPRLGLGLPQGRIMDLSAQKTPLPFDPADMISLIASGEKGLSALRELAARGGNEGIAPENIHLMAPIPRPRKNVFAVGWNYLEHFREGERIRQAGQTLPDFPVFFTKAASAVIGPFDAIPFDPRVSSKIDWEVELGVVIGAGAKNIAESRAMEHVFGYTVINDVSARDLQKRHGGQWFKGKSLDGSCPMGPWIVTREELDPDNLRVMTRVNGVTKQDSNTGNFYFKIPRLIAELSLGMSLEPGDIISTGTPQGVGYARTPPEFLKPGDILETEIEGVGIMKNAVKPAA